MLKNKEGIWPALVLTVICIVTALLLSVAYGATKDRIAANSLGEAGEAMQALLPEADDFVAAEVSDIEGVTGVYEAMSGSDRVGIVVMSQSNGYGGAVPVIVAFKSDNTLAGISISGTSETPGFGKAAEAPEYQEQFKGLPGDKEFTYSGEADKTAFEGISGATATTSAIQAALNQAVSAAQALGN